MKGSKNKYRFICSRERHVHLCKLKVSLLLSFSMKLSNQKCRPDKISVWHIAVPIHRRINITNNDALHTKPLPKLVTVYFSSASIANGADGTSMKHMGDVVSHGVRVQLNNGSSKRECLGACSATTFKVYHCGYTLKVPVFRERVHVFDLHRSVHRNILL
jgi:hypothetical protein